MFVGMGYDVHRFKKGRRLVLGGVEIAHARGLDGHSDADVILHAVMDALLGAAGCEDIGHLFPPSDPAFKDASSLQLLAAVMKVLRKKRVRVQNVDVAVIAEEPKLAPHIPRMKENIAAVLGVPGARIGIKATTNEKMGFIGRGEGIAAMAVCATRIGRAS